jgi:hypothetical protein
MRSLVSLAASLHRTVVAEVEFHELDQLHAATTIKRERSGVERAAKSERSAVS